MLPFTELFINGRFVPSSTGETFEVRNPYTGAVVGTSASASSEDCKDAIEAAQQALKTWENSPLAQRRDIYLKAAELIMTEKYREKIFQAIREETAGSNELVMMNVAPVAGTLRAHAGLVESLRGDVYPSLTVPGAQVVARPRAMGVIFAIAPWNAPVTLALRAVSIPILCGNTAVLKSSEISPRSHSIVVELFKEAGLPDGVLNFVSMSRDSAPSLTSEIIAHPAIRHVNFTGSDRVGKIIAMEAAKYLKPCVLELGGKSPAIVLNDANISEAARSIVFSAMAHSGQVCMATSRVIAQRGISEQLLSEVKSLITNIKAGDVGNDKSVILGALFSPGSAENVVKMLKEAQAQGAEIISGDISRNGAVVQPHLVANVKCGMQIWDREVFGPALVYAVVDTIEEAIELANNTDYSLSASVWSKDLAVAQDVAARIYSGYANINGPSIHSEPVDGLVGLGGASGYGRFSIENFTHKRIVVTHPAGRKLPIVS
ncbi:Vanillin dehydrogenase [Psilocybe cubensis]|uniref:Vanillin dehydrogenase n=2 Tax=Psilocybe cubensis TaxID=181762 RepID=A0ACB8GQA9_PSICU|nr:Vanillin dehydrogenase [Psilocybe cubensis]KAH9477607.1 Vanillin dehydrogenase [Psilocybe cubensis]